MTREQQSPEITLRNVMQADLPLFFEHQLDAEANRMAAFTSGNPADRKAFDAHWSRILAAATIVKRSILLDGGIVGHIMVYEQEGHPEVTYWIGREHWGRGLATGALKLFLGEFAVRPLHARVAKDNAGSLRVLRKCGFVVVGEGRGFAPGRGEEVEEHLLRLDAD